MFDCCAAFGTTSQKRDTVPDGGGKDDCGYECEWQGAFVYIRHGGTDGFDRGAL